VDSLTDEQVMSLLFSDSDDHDLEDDLSFASMARYASGNILSTFLLLDTAATHQREQPNQDPSGADPLVRPSRLYALESLSRQFWELELGERVPFAPSECAKACSALLQYDGKAAPPEALDDADRHMLRTALEAIARRAIRTDG
jgi:hypothetical protein